MPWYAINRIEAEQEIFAREGIPFIDKTIVKPREERVLAFPQEYLMEVGALLKKNLSPENATDTEQDYLKYFAGDAHIGLGEPLLPVGEKERWGVKLIQRNIPIKTPIIDATIGFAKKYNLKITVKNMDGVPHAQLLEDPTELHIRFFSYPGWLYPPGDRPKLTKIDRAFGVSLHPPQRRAYSPTNKGIPITDKEGVLAEVYDNIIFILFKLPALTRPKNNTDRGKVRYILHKILEQYFEKVGMQYFVKVGIIRQTPQKTLTKEEQIAITKEKYILECSKRQNLAILTIEQKIASDRDELQGIQTRWVELIRGMEIDRARLKGIKELSGENERYAIEFDNLLNTPHIMEVKVQKDGVHIYTDTLSIAYNNGIYEIGDFIIHISNHGQLNIINTRAEELTGHAGVHHPHINPGCGMCLGNIENGVYSLIAKYEYAVVAQVLVEFLQTCRYYDTLVQFWKPAKVEESFAKK